MSDLILVIGGTGAQGFEVVKALLGSEEHFSVRVLSRDPEKARVKEQFKNLPVEVVKGSFTDRDAVSSALQGCYGVYVNTDGFTVNEANELAAAVGIYEVAVRVPGLRHFVWSGTDYLLKLSCFNPRYAAHHANAKARFSDYLRSQLSEFSPGHLAWTIYNPPAYTDMLQSGMFQPQITADGTRVFPFPIKPTARIPFITIRDIGAYALAIFLDPVGWSGKTLYPGSHYATGPEIAETLTRVTGLPAKFLSMDTEEWKKAMGARGTAPLVVGDDEGITLGENFAMTWAAWGEDVFVERDFEALRKLHPELESLEGWMRRTGYDGTEKPFLRLLIDKAEAAKGSGK
ncbi:hypothetical protein M409DRAFT_56524 [Zasmidium cellare ATCC 36951]|uniref:NmrA-like domain-containing protein n=1 Tax=Zasmidium cellare ATCC 36951 TaxID=1080233 RepID=A0A6A6CCD3_ZASCE|nr:uncharacterized protein M409DRAFT_56524 [Zasmidium cellare ATCC 36951]KAF2164715.1 hypothetical protein M409DRAFT_56524 [Zasmidium cellare ATCC 36951]